ACLPMATRAFDPASSSRIDQSSQAECDHRLRADHAAVGNGAAGCSKYNSGVGEFSSVRLGIIASHLIATRGSPCQLKTFDFRLEPQPKNLSVERVCKAIPNERRIIVFNVHVGLTDILQ